MRCVLSVWVVLCLIALFLFIPVRPLQAGELPFEVGEKITYQLKWGVVPAGTVVLEVLPGTVIDGQPCRHFRMSVRSNSFIDTFYKVRSVIEGYTDPNLSHSRHYRKKQREGSSRRDIEIRFNGSEHTAQYYNLKEKRGRAPIVVPEGCFDPFSVIYYCRLLDFTTLDMIERPVTDGKKSVIGRVNNRGRQRLIIDDQSYDTFMIEPDIQHLSGVFKKSKEANIFIWLSADERRIPVKLASKVIVGSFTAEMISYQAR